MDNPSYFDNLKELSDEEFLYEVFQNTINGMSRENQGLIITRVVFK